MRNLLLLCVLLGGSCFASEQLDMPEPELVKEIYDWCLSNQQPGTGEKEALLTCVNTELTYSEYQTFSNLQAVETYIKGGQNS